MRAYSIHNKRKHNSSILLLQFCRFQIRDSFAMLFLQTAYFTLVSGCKNTNIFRYISTFGLIIIVLSYLSNTCATSWFLCRDHSYFSFSNSCPFVCLFLNAGFFLCQPCFSPLWLLQLSYSYTLFILYLYLIYTILE